MKNTNKFQEKQYQKFQSFREIKYNDSKRWDELKELYKIVNSFKVDFDMFHIEKYLNCTSQHFILKEIYMLSEKAMCESCQDVAKQFIDLYPDVKVNVVSGTRLDNWKGRE